MNLKTLGSYTWRIIKFILLGLCLILPQQVFALPYILPQNFSPLATNILMWGLLLLGYAPMIVIFSYQFKKGQPTPNMKDEILTMSAGDLEHKIPDFGGNEIGKIGRAHV